MPETIEEIRERVAKAQENYDENLDFIEQILMDERKYVSKKPENEPAVVLCSGGLDSSVMLNKIIEDWNTIAYPLFFRRGARAEKHEEEAFDFFMDFYNKRFPDNIKEPAKIEYEVPPKNLKKNFPKNLALTQGHPLRNSTMQNLAVMHAVSLNRKHNLDIRTILSASVGEDNTEPEQGLLSLRSQTLNTCIQLGDWEWQVTSPLTDFYLIGGKRPIYKTDLIKYAIDKGIPLEKTRTCFSSEKIADGTCFACFKRLDAFNHVGIKDPIRYQKEAKRN